MHDETTIEAVRWRAVRELQKARDAAAENLERATELHERAEEAIRGRNREEVGQWARDVLEDERAVILSLATTGLEDPVDIVEAVVLDRAGETVFSERARPAAFEEGGPIEIESGATRMHGHTAESLADARAFSEVWPELEPVISDASRVIVYNGPYAERVLMQTVDRYRLCLPPVAFQCAMDAYSRVAGEYSIEGQHYYSVRLPGADGTPGGNARALLALLRVLAERVLVPVSTGSGGRRGGRGGDAEHDPNEEDFSDIPF